LCCTLTGIMAVSGCGRNAAATTPGTLQDIAYDVNRKYGYTVYLHEQSGYFPYLVLTGNYNGSALLLRKYLLDQNHTFNDHNNVVYAGYYADSSIDRYLNTDYLRSLDTRLQNIILDSKITITTKSSLSIEGTQTEEITRRVFLLSHTEVCLPDSGTASKEGKPLLYFKETSHQIAYKQNEAAFSWWLRTSSTDEDNTAWGIGPAGEIDGVEIDRKNGVRPAFCLKNTQEIETDNTIVPGQNVYVLHLSPDQEY
jgi:hypothetical protein